MEVTSTHDIFEAARRLVAEHDRRKAEEEQRILDAEREAMLRVFAQHVDAAFDFTSREKVELDPRMDVLEGRGVLEFIVRGHRAIFLLSEGADGKWGLQAAEDDHPLELLTEVEGGNHADPTSRRLAAARIVTAIGTWADLRQPNAPRPELVSSPAAKPAAAPPPAPAPAGRGTSFTPPQAPLQPFQNGETDAIDPRPPRPIPPVPHFGKGFGY